MQHRIVVTRRCLDLTEHGVGLPRGVVPRTISLDEWLAHVGGNPTLVPVRLAANESDALRAAHPVRLADRSTDRWLYWAAGEVRANGPDPALLSAMLRIARALGARVRTDDGGYFRGADPLFPEPPAPSVSPRAIAPRGGDGRSRCRSGGVSADPARSGGARPDAIGPGTNAFGEDALDGHAVGKRAIDGRARERAGRLRGGAGGESEAEARAERRAAQALLVAGTITVVCAASVVWLVQA